MTYKLGKRVKSARGSMTQQQLADALNVTMQHIQSVEYGKSLLSLDKLLLLCKVTGKSPNYFLQDELDIVYNESNLKLSNSIENLTDEKINLLSVALEAVLKYYDNNSKD